VADGKDMLADLQVARRSDRDRAQAIAWRVDLQDRDVFLRCGADQLRVPGRLVGKRDTRRIAALDDVEVGDDMAGIVPDEPGSSAARDLHEVEAKGAAPDRQRGDEHDRRRCLVKELDGRLFGLVELAWRDWPSSGARRRMRHWVPPAAAGAGGGQ